ncbi:hypothetical protein WDZ17_17380 [Pseudokineococcus basanitobsidens]|uniref:F0F1-ATPase subunit (Ca2+/Mg2+ transporter) n=1 Tax=Pseudokineococcus basanitobsidens TaxID=1926649 RepID=A0ABU8RPM9_9ACTN
MAEKGSKRALLVVLSVFSAGLLVGGLFGLINYDSNFGREYQSLPGWAFGAICLSLAGVGVSYIVKVLRGQSVD